MDLKYINSINYKLLIKWHDHILHAEILLANTLRFDFDIFDVHTHMTKILDELGPSDNVRHAALAVLNDSYHMTP
jgi:hypothetical protein